MRGPVGEGRGSVGTGGDRCSNNPEPSHEVTVQVSGDCAKGSVGTGGDPRYNNLERITIDLVATACSKVPGRQTVPRAEAWALIETLTKLDAQRQYTIFVDALYLMYGATSYNRRK